MNKNEYEAGYMDEDTIHKIIDQQGMLTRAALVFIPLPTRPKAELWQSEDGQVIHPMVGVITNQN